MERRKTCRRHLMATLLLVLITVVGARAECEITSTFTQNYEMFYLGDFRVEAMGALDSRTVVWLDLTFTSNTGDEIPLFTGHSSLFTFIEGMPLVVSTTDFTSEHLDYGGQTVNLHPEDDTDFAENALDRVQGNYLATGTYTVTVRLHPASTNNPAYCEHVESFVAVNPNAVWLISPFNGVSVHTETPVFSWTSSAEHFRVRLCQAAPGQFSGEDVMLNDPVWEAEMVTMTSIQLPSSGVRLLENGGTYYWQVFAHVSTTSGPREFPSEIWRFRYSSDETTELDDQVYELLTEYFPGMADEIFQQLTGYSVSGTIMVDGVPLGQEELLNFLDRLQNGQVDVSGISVE